MPAVIDMDARRPGWKQPGRFAFGLSLLVGAAAAAVSLPATAQVTATGDYLERMDADGDGRVSLAEYLDWMGYAFREMDRDGNGVLTSAELPGGKGGPVTLQQHRARLAERFAKQDTNGDGLLDAKELAAPPQR
ncbi:EF-hand domain-containing protein [Luteimonas terricola]|uniref:EF-hand domain-containing protein n=1 Tax=Luteimonas terricola TaxID=645597 RepID=A0ABQ2E8N6_9GAMM|nr:hypothetical protein [Luteimonas terricola]GGJ96399.1 hypothetical protein GCM10011394_01530 [Luteimonas terricola]